MFFIRVFSLVALLASGVPTQGSVPPPPPPPPAAETELIKAAIRRADDCLQIGADGHAKADAATRQLHAKVGSKQWNDARKVVADYVARRQAQRQCLVDLQNVMREGRLPVTKQDRVALIFYKNLLVRAWYMRASDEAVILRRMIGISSPYPVEGVWMW